MSLNLKTLRDQLVKSEQELEQVKAVFYRVDGAIQVLKSLIAEAEKPEPPPAE